MIIQKDRIIARLRERGLNARADWVDKELPDDVDPNKHGGLLATLNLSIEDLADDSR